MPDMYTQTCLLYTSERAAANVDTIKRSSNNVIDFMESEGYFRFKADYYICLLYTSRCV